LRAPDQTDARRQWPRQPLFEREPPRKAALACGSPPRHGLMSFVLMPNASIRCRDAPSHPSFADAKKSQAKKLLP